MSSDLVDYDLAALARDMADRGWSQADLARAAHVSRMTVSRFFGGTRKNPKTAKKLASALGHSVRRYLVEPQPSTPEASRGNTQ